MLRYNIKILSLLFIVQLGCGENKAVIPKWDKDKMQLKTYEKYIDLLNDAYAVNDNYQVALQLANLNGDKGDVNRYLLSSIDENPEACIFIYKNKYLAQTGFYKKIYKYDSIGYNRAFEKCLKKSSGKGFERYVLKQEEEELNYINNRPLLDSTKFNSILISLLEEIHEDDQRLRKEFSKLLFGDVNRGFLAKKQKYLDSLNLIRMDSIVSAFGYPTVEKVGYDYKWTAFFVFHHQIDIDKRDQIYRKYNQYFSDGQKSLFLQRSQEIKK